MTPPDLNQIVVEQTAQIKSLSASVKQMLDEMDRVNKLGIPMSESSKIPVADLMVYNRPLRLLTAVVYNKNAASCFLQFHNSICPVINGSSADLIVPISGNNTATLDFREGPFFSNGLYICGSSTDVTKTIIATNDLTIFATFRRS